MLFQIDVGKLPVEEVIDTTFEELKADAETRTYAITLVRGALEHQEEIDALLAQAANQWSLERFANVDRAILRLALYEILHVPEIPTSVAINEAVEMAKKYSTAESGKFVNGVLGALVRKQEGSAQ